MNPTSHNFHTTRWTIVLKARGDAPEAKAALSDLCEAYYIPVLRFLRRDGKSKDEADELAQSFFARLLNNNSGLNADPAKGRFRSYLLGALKHFLVEIAATNPASNEEEKPGINLSTNPTLTPLPASNFPTLAVRFQIPTLTTNGHSPS